LKKVLACKEFGTQGTPATPDPVSCSVQPLHAHTVRKLGVCKACNRRRIVIDDSPRGCRLYIPPPQVFPLNSTSAQREHQHISTNQQRADARLAATQSLLCR